jgi:hypothetical protein
MTLDLYVLGNHNLNVLKILELGNKVKNRLSDFSLTNMEQLKEVLLLGHADAYKNVNENEIIKSKILRMSIDPTSKNAKFEKEFTSEQEYKQLEIAAKQFSKDQIVYDEDFKGDYLFIGDVVSDDRINISGCMGLSCDIDYNKIDFHIFSIQYKDWLHLHKIVRDEWRKYFYQIIRLFGGNKAIYIPYYIFELLNEYLDYEDDSINIYLIEEYLIEIFGENKKNIDRILENEYCGYVIDDFSDINLDKNMNIDDFKKYLKNIYIK